MRQTPHFHEKLLTQSRLLSSHLENIIPKITSDQLYIYNVFDYAWSGWEQYISTHANPRAHTFMVGINPGPHGMVQTGVPFGNIFHIKNWLEINASIGLPKRMHPKRKVEGLSYQKKEPSGALLWESISQHFPSPQDFFSECFVMNYCPLAFFDQDGKNLTPDALPIKIRTLVEQYCSTHLKEYIKYFQIDTILAIGRYTLKKTQSLITSAIQEAEAQADKDALMLYKKIAIHYITHPSPLNPHHKKFPQELSHYFSHISHR